jgi:hypothetical protein
VQLLQDELCCASLVLAGVRDAKLACAGLSHTTEQRMVSMPKARAKAAASRRTTCAAARLEKALCLQAVLLREQDERSLHTDRAIIVLMRDSLQVLQ